jgi:glutamate synthase (NADPH/NADH) small chain
MELGEPDDSGRRRPKPVAGSDFVIDCDIVVVAIGTKANPLLTGSAPELTVNEWGYLVTDEHGMTSMPGVFAGGDIVRGAATVILAMGDGKRAARSIDSWLNGIWPPVEEAAPPTEHAHGVRPERSAPPVAAAAS